MPLLEGQDLLPLNSVVGGEAASQFQDFSET